MQLFVAAMHAEEEREPYHGWERDWRRVMPRTAGLVELRNITGFTNEEWDKLRRLCASSEPVEVVSSAELSELRKIKELVLQLKEKT